MSNSNFDKEHENEIPDPDALGLIPIFTPPSGETHPFFEGNE